MLYVSNVIDSALDYQILKKGERLDCLFSMQPKATELASYVYDRPTTSGPRCATRLAWCLEIPSRPTSAEHLQPSPSRNHYREIDPKRPRSSVRCVASAYEDNPRGAGCMGVGTRRDLAKVGRGLRQSSDRPDDLSHEPLQLPRRASAILEIPQRD